MWTSNQVKVLLFIKFYMCCWRSCFVTSFACYFILCTAHENKSYLNWVCMSVIHVTKHKVGRKSFCLMLLTCIWIVQHIGLYYTSLPFASMLPKHIMWNLNNWKRRIHIRNWIENENGSFGIKSNNNKKKRFVIKHHQCVHNKILKSARIFHLIWQWNPIRHLYVWIESIYVCLLNAFFVSFPFMPFLSAFSSFVQS